MRFSIRRYLRAGAVICALSGSIVFAQEETPTIPETRVEANPPMLPETDVPAIGFGDGYALDPVVEGTRTSSPLVRGYAAGSATTGTIIDIPDADNPATVNVITRDMMRDQQILQFKDVIRNAGGTSLGGDSFFADRIFIRGIELQSRDFRKDGFLDPTFVPRDFQNVERVEILKGPASFLYGSGSPAGIVNLITKKPLDDSFTDVNAMLGSFDQQRYTIDTNGWVNRGGSTLYRLNVAYEDSDTFRDESFLARLMIAPSITWKLDDYTRLTWLGEYHHDNRRGDQGVPVLFGDPLGLPPNRYVGEPANDQLKFKEYRQTLLLEHEISDSWTWTLGGHSLFYEFPGSVTAASGNPVPGVFPDVPEPFFYRQRTDIPRENEQSHSMITNLAGDFYTGDIWHQSVIGMEYVYFDSNATFNFGAVNPIDVTNPIYLNPPQIPLGGTDFPVYRQQRVGGYIQDLAHLTDQWKLLGGVRFDTLDLTFRRSLAFGGPPIPLDTEDNFERVTPRAGVIFQPFADESLACYFNYAQSFQPPGGGIYTNPGGLRPVTGETFEGGIKTMVLPDLMFNVAGFHTVRNNADLNTSSFFLVQVGEERSQGAEMNLYGDITDRLSAVANYTYADVRLFDPTNPLLDGTRQRNVPYNSANFWTRYNLVQNNEHTFGTALGLVYSDDRPGDLGNTFAIPTYSRWDAGLFYTRGSLYSNVYFENLFDKQYVASSINNFQLFPGAPFNVRAQVGVVY